MEREPPRRRGRSGAIAITAVTALASRSWRHVSGSTLVRLGLAPGVAAAATNCHGFWKSLGYDAGPVQAFTAHVNVWDV